MKASSNPKRSSPVSPREAVSFNEIQAAQSTRIRLSDSLKVASERAVLARQLSLETATLAPHAPPIHPFRLRAFNPRPKPRPSPPHAGRSDWAIFAQHLEKVKCSRHSQ